MSLGILCGLILLAMPWAITGLSNQLGRARKQNVTFAQLFDNKPNINILSLSRVFLFGARDLWFEVPLPFFLRRWGARRNLGSPGWSPGCRWGSGGWMGRSDSEGRGGGRVLVKPCSPGLVLSPFRPPLLVPSPPYPTLPHTTAPTTTTIHNNNPHLRPTSPSDLSAAPPLASAGPAPQPAPSWPSGSLCELLCCRTDPLLAAPDEQSCCALTHAYLLSPCSGRHAARIVTPRAASCTALPLCPPSPPQRPLPSLRVPLRLP